MFFGSIFFWKDFLSNLKIYIYIYILWYIQIICKWVHSALYWTHKVVMCLPYSWPIWIFLLVWLFMYEFPFCYLWDFFDRMWQPLFNNWKSIIHRNKNEMENKKSKSNGLNDIIWCKIAWKKNNTSVVESTQKLTNHADPK